MQHTEQQIFALTGQMAAVPKRVKERELALAEAERELAANAQSLAAEDKNRRSMESTAEDQRRKAARYRVQMDTIQNQSQVEALEHEIGFADQEAARLEDAALESMMRIETLEENQHALQAVVERRKQQLANEKLEGRQSIQRDDAAREILQQQRLSIRATILGEMLDIYDRLAS
ncbi:MAG TPA: hypothetical protein VMU62_04335, partial [Acidobacteriaceae bacterium]|nr:hypothetical protein [Acidobacteriaceae bacterium]